MNGNFGYTEKNGKFFFTFRGKKNLPVWLYLKISKDQFEEIFIECNGEISLIGEHFFYSKNDVKQFIKILERM